MQNPRVFSYACVATSVPLGGREWIVSFGRITLARRWHRFFTTDIDSVQSRSDNFGRPGLTDRSGRGACQNLFDFFCYSYYLACSLSLTLRVRIRPSTTG